MTHAIFSHAWFARVRPLFPYILVFFVGLCLMMVQLVAGRIVAPYIGVSIFTWTSVIGIMLIGMSMGAYVGGVWADQYRSRFWMGLCLIFAGASVLLANYLVPVLGAWFEGSGLALWQRALFFSTACFLAPSFFLSTLTPQVARLYLDRLSKAGTFVGSLGAWNALGSILGTVLAGYILIPILGTKWILTIVASVLLLAGYAIAAERRAWKNIWTPILCLLFIGDLFAPKFCHRETNYFCIRVGQEWQDNSWIYLLRLDHLVHSYVDPEHPAHVGYGYEQLYRHLVALRRDQREVFSSLFIGGGGYALPRYLEALYPKSRIVVTEIDPGVTEANFDLMQLSRDTRIETKNEDARMYLRQASSTEQFDYIFGDAFNDFSVPYHLTTQEFHEELKTHMAPGGVYALNIIDDVRYGKFLAAMIRTLKPIWKHVYVAPLREELKAGRNTYVLIATDVAFEPLSWEATFLPFSPPPADGEEHGHEEGVDDLEEFFHPEIDPATFHLLTDEQVEAFLSAHPAPVLRDDFVPIDRYLAPVFHDAY